MLPFYAAMGIAKDATNFNPDNITAENVNRKYKVTRLDPMNSNIAIVLYECELPIEMNSRRYMIRAFHNENLVTLDGCSSPNCDFGEFISYLEKFHRSCVSTTDVCRI